MNLQKTIHNTLNDQKQFKEQQVLVRVYFHFEEGSRCTGSCVENFWKDTQETVHSHYPGEWDSHSKVEAILFFNFSLYTLALCLHNLYKNNFLI